MKRDCVHWPSKYPKTVAKSWLRISEKTIRMSWSPCRALWPFWKFRAPSRSRMEINAWSDWPRWTPRLDNPRLRRPRLNNPRTSQCRTQVRHKKETDTGSAVSCNLRATEDHLSCEIWCFSALSLNWNGTSNWLFQKFTKIAYLELYLLIPFVVVFVFFLVHFESQKHTKIWIVLCE